MRRQPLIIGAGPAGTAAAIAFARAGWQPRLIERARGPVDKVCGDFLGTDAIQLLCALGVDPVGLGAAPIHRLRLIHRDRETSADLPFPAMGLSRRRLDQALLRQATEAGAHVQMACNVRRIARDAQSWRVDTTRGDRIAADDVFLATGKHDLRDLPRPGTTRGAVGMKMYFRLSPRQTGALSGVIALILFPGGYAGLQSVEAGIAVLCIALRRDCLQAMGGTWSGLLTTITAASPPLDAMLAAAEPLLPRPLAVAGVPYGFLHHAARPMHPGSRHAAIRRWLQDRVRVERQSPASQQTPTGLAPSQPLPALFRIGDQAAVIPSLTGDGIAIALHSGGLAADVWLAGGDASAYHRRLRADLRGQMRLAGLLHAAAMNGALQPAAISAAGWFPALLRQAARGTRLRHQTHTGAAEIMTGLHPA